MPILLTIAGGVLMLAGALVLRSFGEGLRIGRLLSGAREVSIAEAVEMARRGERRYVRVQGRIDAAEPFLDEHGRPLVVRRERVFVRRDGRWDAIAEARHEVPFVLRDRVAEIHVNGPALADGLVVIPREAEGRAGEVPERFGVDVDPALPVRYRIDQVSAVEHAYAVGIPTDVDSLGVRLEPAKTRPLILTTLEIDEAMRILAGGRRRRAMAAAVLLAAGGVCLVLALALTVLPFVLPANVLAASPTPTAAPVGDTRSSGEGPGLVGQPVVIALAVVALGLLTAGLTLLFLRVARPRRGP